MVTTLVVPYVPTDADMARGLEMLTEAVAEYRALSARQRAIIATLVAELRANGATWRQIGAAAGISHVAAMKRWGQPSPVPPVVIVDLVDDDEGEWL